MDSQERQLKVDILERTKRMTSLCNDAESSGIGTVVTLADQGEQLENIQLRLETIDSTLDENRQNIKRMKGLTQRVFDAVRHRFDRLSQSKFLAKRTQSSSKLKQYAVSSRSRRSAPELIDYGIHSSMNLSTPHSNDPLDEKIDKSLCETQLTLQRLKNLALDINDQLTGQNLMLNDVHERVTQSTAHIHQQDHAIRNLV